MRPRLAPASACLVLLMSAAAHAQTEPAAPSPAANPAAPAPAPVPTPAPEPASAPSAAPPEPTAPAELPPATPPAGSPEPTEPTANGLSLGMRLGLGAPAGTAANAVTAQPGQPPSGGSGDGLSSAVNIMFPLQLDASYRIQRRFYVGAYFQWGFVSLPATCPTDLCYDVRLGVQGQYHANPHGTDAWFGLGFGYEILHAGGGVVTVAYRGWELANLQAGVDFHGQRRALGIGPYVSLSFDQYDHIRNLTSSSDVSGSIQNKAIHEWIVMGVHAQFDL